MYLPEAYCCMGKPYHNRLSRQIVVEGISIETNDIAKEETLQEACPVSALMLASSS